MRSSSSPLSSTSLKTSACEWSSENTVSQIIEVVDGPRGRQLALDVLQDAGQSVERVTPLEQIIDERIQSLGERVPTSALADAGHLGRSLDLVRAVRASMYTSASSRICPWRQYVLAPSVAVLRLRSLVARGRARERGVVSGPTPRPIAWLLAPQTPREIVWNVLAFWNPRYE